jgi:FKBP-type peptidyl-prolyl cis-trans isomerase
MRVKSIIWGVLGIAGLFVALPMSLAQEKEEKPAKPPGEFKSATEQFSYGVGREIGGSIKSQGLELEDVDIAALAKGIEDALAGAESRVSIADMKVAARTVQKSLRVKAKQRREEQAKLRLETDAEFKALAEKNATAGAAFLKENQAKDGVKVTASGLHYQVLKEGKGAKPGEFDVVETHYHGTFPDGKVFDSSVERKMPSTFPVDRVIDGWTEALQLMPIGSKWRLVVPAKLAYGLSGSGEDIGPNQVLVFEVELLKIVTPDDEAAEPAVEEPAKDPGAKSKE